MSLTNARPADPMPHDRRRGSLPRVLHASLAALALGSHEGRSQPLSAADAARVAARPMPDRSNPALDHGETQTVFLLKLAAEAAQAERGLPLEALRERVSRAVLTHPETLAARATQQAAGEATRELGAAALPQIDTRLDAAHRQTV